MGFWGCAGFGLSSMFRQPPAATDHAEEEMNDDGLTIFDVEHVILTGEIVERQKDRDTGEWKYLIEGQTEVGEVVIVVTKLSLTGKLVIITVYVE